METKENVKIGLLAVIATTLLFNTFMDLTEDSGSGNAQTVSVNSPMNPSQSVTPDLMKPNETQAPIQAPTGPLTSIKFEEDVFDFGNVKQDSENKHMFKFKNTGSEPLLISNARGSCGCTVPKYPTEPIPPGGTAEIEVIYKPGKQVGAQNKTVTVTANTEPMETIFQIKANVEQI